MKRKILGEKRYAYAPNAHNFIHLLLHEVIDMDRLYKALTLLHRVNPILNSFLAKTETGFELTDIPFMLPEVIVMERKNEKTYKKVMKEEERIPLNLHQNSGYRLIVIKDEEYTDIILMTHQILVDAYSSLVLVKAILDAYDKGILIEFAYDSVSCGQLHLNLIDRKMLNHAIVQYKDDPMFLVEEDYRKKYMEYYRTYTTKFMNIILTSEESNALLSYCRMYNLDVYALIFTAFKASEDKYQKNRDRHFSESVIMKNLRDKKENFGNYATLGFISFTYNAKHSLVENTRAMMKCLEKCDYSSYYLLNNEFSLGAFKALEDKNDISYSLMHFAHKLGYWNYLIGTELSFANEIDWQTNLNIETIEVLRATHRLVEKNISIVKFNSNINIAMQCNSLSANEKDMKDILRNTKDILIDSIKE